MIVSTSCSSSTNNVNNTDTSNAGSSSEIYASTGTEGSTLKPESTVETIEGTEIPEDVYKNHLILSDSYPKEFFPETDSVSKISVTADALSPDHLTVTIENMSDYSLIYSPCCEILYVTDSGDTGKVPSPETFNYPDTYQHLEPHKKETVTFTAGSFQSSDFAKGDYIFRINTLYFELPEDSKNVFSIDIPFHVELRLEDPLAEGKIFKLESTDERDYFSENDPDKDEYRITVKANEISLKGLSVTFSNKTEHSFSYGLVSKIYQKGADGTLVSVDPTGYSKPLAIGLISYTLPPAEEVTLTFFPGYFRAADFAAGDYIIRIGQVGFFEFENISSPDEPVMMLGKRNDYAFFIDIPFSVNDK